MSAAEGNGDHASHFDPTWEEVLWGGEFPSLSASFVVSPARGRFHRDHLREGVAVQVGTVIGEMSLGRERVLPVTSPVAGVFQGWLAWEGENVERGTPLAHIAVNGSGRNGAITPNGNGINT